MSIIYFSKDDAGSNFNRELSLDNTGKSLAYIFCNCSSLKSLPDISNWNTQNVVNMSGIFSGCSDIISLPDISKWNVDNVTDLSNMFF